MLYRRSVLFVLITFHQYVNFGVWCLVTCYKCSDSIGSCNAGECTGQACFKVEARNNNKVSVQKGCLATGHKASCVRTNLLGVEALKCICLSNNCNGDAELKQLGLLRYDIELSLDPTKQHQQQRSSKSNSQNVKATDDSRWSTNFIVMIIFACLFIGGAVVIFTLNTICMHSC